MQNYIRRQSYILHGVRQCVRDYETRYRYTSELSGGQRYAFRKKIPGLMKKENNGAIMTEFIGFRAKMYAVRMNSKKDIKKAKGIKSNIVTRMITFDYYTRCLKRRDYMTHRIQSCIRSKLHEIYTISE